MSHHIYTKKVEDYLKDRWNAIFFPSFLSIFLWGLMRKYYLKKNYSAFRKFFPLKSMLYAFRWSISASEIIVYFLRWPFLSIRSLITSGSGKSILDCCMLQHNHITSPFFYRLTWAIPIKNHFLAYLVAEMFGFGPQVHDPPQLLLLLIITTLLCACVTLFAFHLITAFNSFAFYFTSGY